MSERVNLTDAQDTEAIRSLLEQRAALYDVEKSVMADKKALNEKIQMYMDQHDYAGIQDETFGSVVKVTQTRDTLDKDILKGQLLLKGVSTAVIAEAFAVATKSTSTTFIKFESPNRK
jgi:hypothetical protein